MLENATTKNLVGAPVVTIIGEQGLGKTSLAASFPKPFFIWVEDGSKAIPKNAGAAWLPNEAGNGPKICQSSKEVIDQIRALGQEKHGFQTLVIDSITQLNTIIEQEIIDSDPGNPKGINQAFKGFGNGHSAVSSVHQTIRNYCERLKDRKRMAIVFIGHTDTENMSLPDQDLFTRYTLRMNKRSVSHYSDNVDIVAHVKHQIYLNGDKRAVTGGRLISCVSTPASISKNRYGIKEDLDFEEGTNPLLDFIIPKKASKAGE
jgi:hypothetical protein